jgi:hypothetical protein
MMVVQELDNNDLSRSKAKVPFVNLLTHLFYTTSPPTSTLFVNILTKPAYAETT